MENTEIYEYILGLCRKSKSAAPYIAKASTDVKNKALLSIAKRLDESKADIIKANDLDLLHPGVPKNMLDRLRLDEKRIDGIADSLYELVKLADPIGKGETWTRPNGLRISCVKSPLGVVGIIYEARPNVTVDAAALCIKTGNAVILRGGKEAINTNRVLIDIIRKALSDAGLPCDCVSLVDDTTREGTAALMSMRGYLDVLIPRGGKGLIRSVVDNAKVPVIETGAGNCHIYIDESADIDMAVRVAVNAKASRPAVCNSVETMLVHESIAEEFLPAFKRESDKYNVEIRGCARTMAIIDGCTEATEEDYMTEYDDYILAVKLVSGVDEAIEHINKYSTGHSESIITDNLKNAEKFKQEIDSAAVYVNASTRFTDGGEFGFGAEIGISTQKLHARGPMGLDALTTQKYLIDGCGQVR